MIVKMKFLNIRGPQDDIDRVCDVYLSKYEMQLENAITELRTTDSLLPFVDVNPYKDLLNKAEQFVALITDDKAIMDVEPKSLDEITTLIRDVNHDYMTLNEQKEVQKKAKDEVQGKINTIEPFRSLDFDFHKVMNYKFMEVRFGRISVDNYDKLWKYLMDDLYGIFFEGTRTESYVYGCYFVANEDARKVDGIFNSLKFERIDINDEYAGTPEEALAALNLSLEEIAEKIDKYDKDIEDVINNHAAALKSARRRLSALSTNFDVRKLAARVETDGNQEYILVGWMTESDTEGFLSDVKDDKRVTVTVEDSRETYFDDPPTKLKNPRIFKPFELFISMYGTPAHNEMDPTIFIAITYTLMFGAMFGDAGQGLVLFIGGGILYLIRKMKLAGIISLAGVCSIFFGFMYGSFFGFENILHPIWLRPVDAMTKLPFIGQLNSVFVIAVAFGMGLNILVMLFNIVNAIKAKDLGTLLFSNNGLAGIIFYGFIVLTIVLFMTGHKVPGNILMIVFLGIPIILFFLKEPLTNAITHNHKKIEGGKGMFAVSGFFELFETMLSYFSNTLSYVRIGAFAVSHAAIMQVVLMLSGAEAGHANMIGVIVGNIIVMGLEGLVVGIQVLRLEYYELFSRFYKGNGREFVPFKTGDNKKSK